MPAPPAESDHGKKSLVDFVPKPWRNFAVIVSLIAAVVLALLRPVWNTASRVARMDGAFEDIKGLSRTVDELKTTVVSLKASVDDLKGLSGTVKQLEITTASLKTSVDELKGLSGLVARLDERIKHIQERGFPPARSTPSIFVLSKENCKGFGEKESRFEFLIPEQLTSKSILYVNMDVPMPLAEPLAAMKNFTFEADLSEDRKLCVVRFFGDQTRLKTFMQGGGEITVKLIFFMRLPQ